MAITIKKKTTKKKTTSSAATLAAGVIAQTQGMIDDAGAKQDKYKAIQAKASSAKKEFDDAKSTFYKTVIEPAEDNNELPVDAKETIDGKEYRAEIGKHAITRKVADLKGVFVALENVQEGLALQLMSFKLTDLDKYLTKAQLDKLLKVDRAELRPVKFSKLAKVEEEI